MLSAERKRSADQDTGVRQDDPLSRRLRSARPRAVVLTELFPPTIGGSGELLANVYSRFGEIPVTVLTGAASGDTPSLRGPSDLLTVRRDTKWSRNWGLLHPVGGWRHLVRTQRLLRLARAGQAVVHCARAFPEGLDGYLAKRLGGADYICWVYGEELAYTRYSRELSRFMPLVYRNAGAILAISQNTARHLVEFGVPADRITIIRPGVDAERFSPKAASAQAVRRRLTQGDEVVLMTIGRLQRRKGHDLVLQTLATLGPESPPVRYVVVGGGPEEPRLQQMARELGVAERVTFVGAVPAEELPGYYAAADIFVHPNRNDGGDFEGFGIVLLEAAASGLPVIAGDTGGSPEAVENGSTGVLVSGVSVDQLKTVLLELIRSPFRRRTMGEAGRTMVLSEFSWDHAAASVAAIHERVASSSGLGIAAHRRWLTARR